MQGKRKAAVVISEGGEAAVVALNERTCDGLAGVSVKDDAVDVKGILRRGLRLREGGDVQGKSGRKKSARAIPGDRVGQDTRS